MVFQPPHKWDTGWVEVICGSMFSGKTEELIRRIKRSQIAKQKVQLFKPAIDTRYSKTQIISHSELKVDAQIIKDPEEILTMLKDDTRVVGIDEAQFLPPSIVDVTQKLANKCLRVIVAGLDLDYRGVPFGPMPTLMAVAESVTKMNAICVKCGNLATRSFRIPSEQAKQPDQVVVGGADIYEARCRGCCTEGI